MHITNWQTHKQRLLANPAFKKELDDLELNYQVARLLIEARIKKGLTQQELAALINTKQAVISRVETGQTMPSLSLLKRLAGALGTTFKLEIK